MEAAVKFLTSFARAISALSLYPEGHVSRERALEQVYEHLQDLLAEVDRPRFSFLGEEIVYGTLPIKELRNWDWSKRLSDVGIQQVEFNSSVTRDELEEFLDGVLARLTLSAIDTSEARQMRPSGIRYGEVGIRGEDDMRADDIDTATISFTLTEEAETVRWLHQELTTSASLHLTEAEAVVRGLSVAMHGDQKLILPLLKLREFDEYTTTHSINVAVLTMGLSEWMGMGARDVRAFGVAGLLHDLGKVRVPIDVLNKKGKLTEQERELMNTHPTEGAKIIISSHDDLDMAAVVAYEHHIMLNGGGYPRLRYERDCHRASKLVHVCDVYDALRTKRPYRDAWPAEKVLAYLEERSGVEFDGEIAHGFTHMMREWEPQVATLSEEEAVPAG